MLARIAPTYGRSNLITSNRIIDDWAKYLGDAALTTSILDRFDYAEQRFVTLGTLAGLVVSIVHTETPRVIRIVSFRQATTREQAIYYAQIRN